MPYKDINLFLSQTTTGNEPLVTKCVLRVLNTENIVFSQEKPHFNERQQLYIGIRIVLLRLAQTVK